MSEDNHPEAPADAAVDATELQRSSRDHSELRERLQQWLGTQLGADAGATVTSLNATSANGMSSDTILFDASWTDADGARDERLVARIAPAGEDVPVFPSYNLTQQYDAIRRVAALTDVPVPATFWNEPDPAPIGSPFFVMGRIDGEVPPDVMPYNFGDSWVYDSTPEQQQTLQRSSIDVLARLHAIESPESQFPFLELEEPGETALRRRVAHTRAWYEFAIAGGPRSSLIERAFDWLDDHWPAEERPTVLSWGDSRIGNMMYRDFEPVAVLDWEMACLAPRELDIAWMVYAHRVFEDIAHMMELPGMPDFLRPDDASAIYESLTGYAPRHLEWYTAYSAVQYAIVFARTGRRSVHFGEREMPDDIDEMIMNREPLEQMLAGTYWT